MILGLRDSSLFLLSLLGLLGSKRRFPASRVPFWPIQSMQSLFICFPDPYLNYCHFSGQSGARVTPAVTQCDITEIALRSLYGLLRSKRRILASRVLFWPIQSMQSLSIYFQTYISNIVTLRDNPVPV